MNSSLICERQSCVQIMYRQINTHRKRKESRRKSWENGEIEEKAEKAEKAGKKKRGKWQVDKHQGEWLRMVTEMETKQILISFSGLSLSPHPHFGFIYGYVYIYIYISVYLYLCACISICSIYMQNCSQSIASYMA